MLVGQKRYLVKQRKERQCATAFKALIATPASGTVVLPSQGRFAVASAAGSAYGTLAATVTASVSREIYTKLLSANELQIIDSLENKSSITLESGFKLYVDVGLNVFKLIAQG